MVPEKHAPPSLLGITLRRGILAGRLYLVLGTVLALILSIVLIRSRPGAFAVTFPLEIPLFAALGATGGIVLFASDRSKGVLEYSIAYGVRPFTLFANILLTTVALATIIAGAALVVGLGTFVAAGNVLTWDLEESLLYYTIPMTYASSLFATVCGMIWSSLSTPRAGLNSPVGITPLLSVGPPILVLILAESALRSQYYYITAGASAAFLVLVVLLLLVGTRSMDRERYLSQM